MATDTTGSTVQGLVSGMKQHLGGGASLMFVQGNPKWYCMPCRSRYRNRWTKWSSYSL